MFAKRQCVTLVAAVLIGGGFAAAGAAAAPNGEEWGDAAGFHGQQPIFQCLRETIAKLRAPSFSATSQRIVD